jgi:hypothetical protein
MKKALLLLFSILLTFMLISCDKDKDKPDDDIETVVSSVAKAITEQQSAAITGISPTQIMITAPSGNSGYQVGDIMVSAPTELAPDGFLRRVTSVAQEGTEAILGTEQARLTDVFEQVNIVQEQSLRTTDIRKSEFLAKGIRMAPDSKDPLTFNYTLNYTNSEAIPGTTINVTGGLQLNMGYVFEFRTRLGQGLTYLKGGAFITEESELQLDVQTSIFSIEESIELASHEFQPIIFFVSGFPIVIVPKVVIVLNIDGQGSTNVSTRVETSASASAGLIYQNNAWEPFQSKEISFGWDPPTLQGSFATELAAGPRLEMNLYGVVGPFVTGFGILDLEASLQNDPWWVLNGGFRADAGIHMDIIADIQDYVLQGIIDHRQTLAEAEGVITGRIEGSVFNASNNSPLSDVTVEMRKVSTPTVVSYTTTTAANGSFGIDVAAGIYNVGFSKPGFISATQYDVGISGFTTNPIQTVLQIDEAYQGIGTISGFIMSALTNIGVENVNLFLRAGINNVTGTVVSSTQTAANGAYSFSEVDAGNYTVSSSRDGYLNTSFSVICLGGQDTQNQNAIITPEMDANEVRIVLTWGETPRDLDSHLTGPIPGSEDRFHVYFSAKEFYHNSELYAMLDIDDVSSYGPETTTIYVQTPGLYRFSVHDWTNGGSTSSYALSNSSAQVMVWRGNSHVQTFHVPNSQMGTVWTVFEMAGTQIVPINELSNNTDYKAGDVDWNALPQKR